MGLSRTHTHTHEKSISCMENSKIPPKKPLLGDTRKDKLWHMLNLIHTTRTKDWLLMLFMTATRWRQWRRRWRRRRPEIMQILILWLPPTKTLWEKRSQGKILLLCGKSPVVVAMRRVAARLVGRMNGWMVGFHKKDTRLQKQKRETNLIFQTEWGHMTAVSQLSSAQLSWDARTNKKQIYANTETFRQTDRQTDGQQRINGLSDCH